MPCSHVDYGRGLRDDEWSVYDTGVVLKAFLNEGANIYEVLP